MSHYDYENLPKCGTCPSKTVSKLTNKKGEPICFTCAFSTNQSKLSDKDREAQTKIREQIHK